MLTSSCLAPLDVPITHCSGMGLPDQSPPLSPHLAISVSVALSAGAQANWRQTLSAVSYPSTTTDH